MILDQFAVFILSHKRPDNVLTIKTLRKSGYTGKIYILLDNQDPTVAQYKKSYNEEAEILVFDKINTLVSTDAGDNFEKRNTVLYARNDCFEIAKSLGLKFFLQLDDDYKNLRWTMSPQGEYWPPNGSIKSLNPIFAAFLRFLDESKVDCIAFAQSGDFIGGSNSQHFKSCLQGKYSRKAMNSFFFSTERPLKFYGRMNDDVNMYIVNGMRGKIILTCPRVRLRQMETQQNSGGLTEMYLEAGTYQKSFYSILYRPDCIKISAIGDTHRRIHHRINWKRAVPKIIGEEHKKRNITQQDGVSYNG